MGTQEPVAEVDIGNKTKCHAPTWMGPHSGVCPFRWVELLLTLHNFNRYLQESSVENQEQAFNILRNVAESPEGIDMIFNNITPEVILGSIAKTLTSSSDDVVLQASPDY